MDHVWNLSEVYSLPKFFRETSKDASSLQTSLSTDPKLLIRKNSFLSSGSSVLFWGCLDKSQFYFRPILTNSGNLLTNISMYHGECCVSCTLTIPVVFQQMWFSPSTTRCISHDLTALCFFKRNQVSQAFIDVAMTYHPREHEDLKHPGLNLNRRV